MQGQDSLHSSHQHNPQLSKKEEMFQQFAYTKVGSSETGPVDVYAELLTNAQISPETYKTLHELRKAIIEQKAYNQFSFSQENMYRDVAADASLWGQLMLLDIILKSVNVSE